MAKSISTIQTELCDSEIGKLRNPISLYQVIGELYSTADVNPPPITLLTDLQGYWNGGSATADLGAMVDWVDPGGDVVWGYDLGPNGYGSSFYQALSGAGGGTGGLGVVNNDPIVQQMTAGGKTTVMVWAAATDPEYSNGLVDVISKAEYQGYGLILTPNMYYELYHSLQDGNCDITNDYYFPIPFNEAPSWNQFVMVNGPNAGDKKVYMNGNFLGASPTVGFCPTNTEPLRIEGRFWELPLSFALMGFWTRELDATEIATLYNGGLGLSASEL